MKTAIKRVIRLVVVMAVSVVSLGVTSRSEAQGTFGMVPEPMSTVEVTRYGDRLGLSNAQRAAVENLHDAYKAEFKALREGDIEQAMKQMSQMNGGMPSRKAVEEWVKTMDDVRGKIERVDNKFFDGMQAILTPEQIGLLGKVKQQRERARCGSGQMMRGLAEGAVDLTDDYLDLKLAPEESAASDEVMNQYENVLTIDMRKLEDATSKMFLKIYDALDARGFNEESMKDPEKQKEMMQVMQAAWAEATKDITKQSDEITALNKRTFKSLYSSLPEKQGRAFRREFYAKAYQEAWFVQSDAVPSRVDAAKKMEGVTDDQKTQLDDLLREHNQALDQLTENATMEIDEFRKGRNLMAWDSDSWQEHSKKMQEIQTKAAERDKASMERMAAILGEERSQKLSLVQAGDAAVNGARITFNGTGGEKIVIADDEGAESMEDATQIQWGPDQFLPPAISERDLKAYAKRTGLTDDQAAVMAGIHDEYLAKWKELEEHEIKAVQESVKHQWDYDEKTGTQAAPTEQKVETLYRLRRTAMDAIERLDNSFFADVEATVLNKGEEGKMKPARWMRARESYNRMQSYGWWGGSSSESKIDLYKLVSTMHPGKDELKAIDGDLRKYEEQAAGVFKELYDAGLQSQQAQEKFQAEIQREQAAGNFDGMSYQQKMKDMLGSSQEALKKVNQKVLDLNRQYVTALSKGLDSDRAARFESQYRRLAHPSVYNDATSMEEPVIKSLRLGSLTDDQRQQLEALATEYRPAYAAKCEEMLKLKDGISRYDMLTGGDQEQWKKIMEQQQQLQKVQYDRGELSQRALAKLQRILTDEQLKQVGPLPDAKAFEQNQNGMFSGID